MTGELDGLTHNSWHRRTTNNDEPILGVEVDDAKDARQGWHIRGH